MKCTRCERFLAVKHFYLTCLLFFSSLENYFGFRTTNVKGKTDHPSVSGGIKGLNISKEASIFSDCVSD